MDKSDTLALELGLQSLHLSGGQPSANRKVEEWLQKQSTAASVVATDTSLPGKPDGPKDGMVVGSPSFTDNSLAMVGSEGGRGREEGGGRKEGGREGGRERVRRVLRVLRVECLCEVG